MTSMSEDSNLNYWLHPHKRYVFTGFGGFNPINLIVQQEGDQ